MHIPYLKHLLLAHLHHPILLALALWLLGFGILGLGTISIDDPPPGHPFHGMLDKVLHFSAFSILAVLLFALPRHATGHRSACGTHGFACIPHRLSVARRWWIPFRLVFASGAGCIAAVMSEVVQHLVNSRRVFDWLDISANLLGIAFGLLLSLLARNVYSYHGHRQGAIATSSISADTV